jgi:lipopolysaccharide export system permease protein
MKLIERYIFKRLLGAWLLALLVLCTTVWMTQAVQQITLITSQGQGFLVFMGMTALLFPQLIAIVAPLALLIAVIYTFSTLNNDAELVVINASGTPQSALLKPVVAVTVIGAILVGFVSLYLAPLAQRTWRSELTAVKANIVTMLLREGTFVRLADGLVFHMRQRGPDGTIEGIFVSDSREPGITNTYLAEDGKVIQNPVGTFIIMNAGSIQRRDNTSGAISMIEFTSYAFDLTTFASRSREPGFGPMEQTTAYLLNPDPDDKQYQKSPGSFAAELNARLAAPLLMFIFSLVPLVYLAQADSTRNRRMYSLVTAAGSALILRVLATAITSATAGTLLAPAAFIFPIIVIAVAAAFILTGTRPRMPERAVGSLDAVVEWATNLFRRSAHAGSRG